MSSDSGNDAARSGTPTAGEKPPFTDREMQMLGWAMQSLKSGPPEIDYVKLAGFAGMSNPRSAGNAWAKIRTKIEAQGGEGVKIATPKKTPQKKAAASKKAAADKGEDDDKTSGETEPETPAPKKTPRKRTPKKQEVDGEEGTPKKRGRPATKKEDADGEPATPKKRGRPAKTKAADKGKDEEAATVKEDAASADEDKDAADKDKGDANDLTPEAAAPAAESDDEEPPQTET